MKCFGSALVLGLILLPANIVSRAIAVEPPETEQSRSVTPRSATRFLMLLDQLDLIGFQKFQLEQLREQVDAAIVRILAPDQVEVWQASREAGLSQRAALEQLNLKAEQQQQLQEMRQEVRAVFRDILTDQQWQELETLLSQEANNLSETTPDTSGTVEGTQDLETTTVETTTIENP